MPCSSVHHIFISLKGNSDWSVELYRSNSATCCSHMTTSFFSSETTTKTFCSNMYFVLSDPKDDCEIFLELGLPLGRTDNLNFTTVIHWNNSGSLCFEIKLFLTSNSESAIQHMIGLFKTLFNITILNFESLIESGIMFDCVGDSDDNRFNCFVFNFDSMYFKMQIAFLI